MKMRLVLVLALTMVANAAQAGFMIDPYIGLGQSKSTLDVANDQEETSGSSVVGSRLGYSFILFSGGIDYQIMKTEDSNEEDATLNNLSAFVGVDLPILFRFWAEYFLSSNLDSDTNGVDFAFKDGYGLGIGFTGLPFVSLNLEIEALNFDAEVGGTDFDYSVASTILSVSMPFDF